MDHDFPFDPTYGYGREQLLQVGSPDGPSDFAEFWRRTFQEAERVEPNAAVTRVDSPSSDHELYLVEFDSLGGVRTGGWLVRPASRAPTCGFVIGHGYGSRSGPDFWFPIDGAAAIFPCARGFGRSAHPEIPDAAAGHVLHGINNRDSYVHRGCAAEIWAAATVLLQQSPEVSGRLYYMGGSFGGGIGALAVPWDRRFRRAHLGVPSFGNHPLRLTLECVGSGESVRQYAKDCPDVTDVLAYFDAATAARHIQIPVSVSAALFDPAVPPPGQFAVYNALAGERDLHVLSAAHFEYAGQELEGANMIRRLKKWFTST